MAERRIVSVLFADVVGFTSLAEGLDPEDLATVQDAYFAAVEETLQRYGGVLEKFIGDAAVAVFGVPRARDDDAERAVRAALALHGAVSNLSAGLGLEAGSLLIRVGVNTGEVAYSPGDGRVTGDAVNVAARLQAAAPPGRVTVGPDTALAVADAFELEPLGGLDLKGKADAVRGSVVAGVRPSPSRDAALGRLRASTVGRRAELDALVADVRTIADGRPRWALLVAPPGVGKSRLVRELARTLRSADEHVRVLTARCVSEAPHAYAPVADLLVEALRASGLDASLPARAVAEAAAPLLRERLGAAGVPDVERVVEQAVALLAGEAGVGSAERTTRFAAWATTFRVLEDGVPTIWLVEDVHDASLDALSFLAAAATPTSEPRGPGADATRMVLLTGRPAILSHDPGWVERAEAPDANGRLLHLAPLGGADAMDLVRQLVGDALPDELVQRVAEASDGNPLFVEELLRTWLILGVLRETYDGLELAAAPEHVLVPSTVQVLYAAQLDDLPADARVVAQNGAVIGRTFPVDGLEVLAADTTTGGLPALTDRALVEGPVEERLGAAYSFRHALLRDSAYRTLARTERARLHVAAAAWLQVAATGVDEQPDLVAHHYAEALRSATLLLDPIGELARAEVTHRARTWRLRAAHAALDTSAFEAAQRHAELLLELLGDEPDDHPLRAPAAEVLGTAAANTNLDLGAAQLDAAANLYELQLGRATATSAERREAALGHARTTARLADLRYDQAAFGDVRDLTERSLALVAPVLGDEEVLELRAWRLRGLCAMADADNWSDLEPQVHALVADALATRDDRLVFVARSLQLEYDASVQPDEQARLVREQVERAERLGRWRDVVILHRMMAGAALGHDPAAALVAAREVPGLARSFGLVEAEAFATYGIVEAALAAGSWDEALEAGVRALDLAERHAVTRAYVRTTFALAAIAAGRGERDLLARMTRAHELQRADLPPLSGYARVVLCGTRRWAGLAPPLQDEPAPADVAEMFFGSPSGCTQAEVTVHGWLAEGRDDEVKAFLEHLGAVASSGPGTGPLNTASRELIAGWVALAAGDSAQAAVAAERAVDAARACGAPFWEARALRVLEAVGSAPATAVERRVRLEIDLGIVHPQLPPVVPDGVAGP